MGLLDQVLGGGGGQQQKPGMGDTVAMGVMLALLVKAVRSHQANGAGQPDAGRSFDPAAQGQGGGLSSILGGLGGSGGGLGQVLGGLGGAGGLGGMLGGLGGAGGGGLSSVLGSLGGSGALGALLGRLQQGGLGQQAQSWVSTGENQPADPQQLGAALGEDTLQALQQQTGMPREGLLQQLSHLLPQAVDAATPDGRTPTDQELHEIAQRPQPS